MFKLRTTVKLDGDLVRCILKDSPEVYNAIARLYSHPRFANGGYLSSRRLEAFFNSKPLFVSEAVHV